MTPLARLSVRCAALLALASSALAAQQPERSTYFMLVLSSGADQVSLVHLGPRGLAIDHRTSVRLDPSIPNEPSAMGFNPITHRYFLGAARSVPPGVLISMALADTVDRHLQQPVDTILDTETLGGTATAVVAGIDGLYVWALVGTRPGSARPAVVKGIYVPRMIEAAEISTCVGGTGLRSSPDGAHLYTLCRGESMLLDIDTGTGAIARRIALGPGCAPTVLALSSDGATAYVACTASRDVAIVDVTAGVVGRHVPGVAAAAAIAVTPDQHRMVIADAGSWSATVVDVEHSATLASIPLDEFGTSDIAVSDDGRYAFVTSSADAGRPGQLTAIDLASLATVSTLRLGAVASAVIFWRTVAGVARQP